MEECELKDSVIRRLGASWAGKGCDLDYGASFSSHQSTPRPPAGITAEHRRDNSLGGYGEERPLNVRPNRKQHVEKVGLYSIGMIK